MALRAVPVILGEHHGRIIMDGVVEADYIIWVPGFDARKHFAHVNLVDHYIKADVVSGLRVYLVYGLAGLRVYYLARVTRDTDAYIPSHAAV